MTKILEGSETAKNLKCFLEDQLMNIQSNSPKSKTKLLLLPSIAISTSYVYISRI